VEIGKTQRQESWSREGRITKEGRKERSQQISVRDSHKLRRTEASTRVTACARRCYAWLSRKAGRAINNHKLAKTHPHSRSSVRSTFCNIPNARL
jgi:hypothetical protein